ncbi:hypothetical protein GCM10010472_53380 [Pseudonocardia halophobica]|uniref:Uncharacterized protein n=1 Tax=Pseudonocardia halophobica TaxID=29401 RepID=A0A9W6L2F9_9PSEU|nr:hypothetical protein GCM10017577_31640 [Pseudonocardia halophobica]
MPHLLPISSSAVRDAQWRAKTVVTSSSDGAQAGAGSGARVVTLAEYRADGNNCAYE